MKVETGKGIKIPVIYPLLRIKQKMAGCSGRPESTHLASGSGDGITRTENQQKATPKNGAALQDFI
ncbi:hypothetical protein [uncultured Chryseobacterium sp.]|uniref:hypothetical protein n=1 Tax=uncultured Chryseobacterium sp. TaxID=259322 RepID=UPI0025EF5E9D|nr:hypothetical protein [uncultured Chryseobacterium sp.]